MSINSTFAFAVVNRAYQTSPLTHDAQGRVIGTIESRHRTRDAALHACDQRNAGYREAGGIASCYVATSDGSPASFDDEA